jgi:hypothetical protein
MSELPHPARPVYRLRIMSTRGDDIRRLRARLKALLRSHGWRCVSVEQEYARHPKPSERATP